MKYNKKMEEIKGVKVFAGVEIGKEAHLMSLIAKDGEVIESGMRIVNSKEGFKEMLKVLTSIICRKKCRLQKIKKTSCKKKRLSIIKSGTNLAPRK